MRKTDKPQGPRIVSGNEETATPDNLTPTEMQLLRLFQQVSDAHQTHTIAVLLQLLKSPSCRRAPPKPTLRMITGGRSA